MERGKSKKICYNLHMPELPEVETIRMGLEKYLVGKVIYDIEVRLEKQLEGNPKNIIGTQILSVRRFGKALVIDFANAFSLAIHIKMTGQLIYRGPETKAIKISPKVGGELPHKFTHIIFKLRAKGEGQMGQEESYLYYNDIRQFGWMKIVKTEDLTTLPFFKDIGPEPFKDLTLPVFETILSKTKAPIKVVLLDQKRLAGVGNIYANDALFLAKIHPKRPASSLTKEETKALFDAIEEVLKKGLEVGGASEWQYVNAEGTTGNYQDFFQIYGKDGEPCSICGTIIQRMNLGGRGTFFCDTCQM